MLSDWRYSPMQNYEKLNFQQNADAILLSFCENMLYACQKSEFQFLSHDPQKWQIPSDVMFHFPECCYIQNSVPIYSQSLWDGLMKFLAADGLFTIPLVIAYHGEQHYYVIAIPSRIHCLDENGKILPEQTGRYQMFKSENMQDNTIYLCGDSAEYLKQCTALNLEGVV